MATPTDVNDQITDAVTQTNTKVLGEVPAEELDMLLEPTKQALENAAHNATHGEQGVDTAAQQAAITQGVATLYEVDTAASGIDEIYDGE